MKHKFFTLLFAILASLGTMFAQSGTCGDNLAWNLTNGVLTISGTGAMTDYTSSSKAPWFAYSNSINSVVIGDGVTSIGEWAFSNCNGMTSATIGNSVASIGDYAFFECSALTSTGIPNSVTTIGNSAFIRCTSLESVVIPGSVTRFGNYAFYQCNSLSSVVIVYGVTSIGIHAFDECSNLASVSLPNSITSIEEASFRNCSSLTSVTIPNSVISIGESAFRSCTSLTSVSIPNSVKSIGNGAFAGGWSLASVEISNSVTSIDESAFGGCSYITNIFNHAIVPQVIVESTFSNVNKYACTLYVPAESVSAYQAADVWKEFGNILPIEGSEEVNYATLADIYNMAADSTFTLGAFDVMYVPDFQSGSNMYIKDSTGSCVIYKVNYGLQAGDHVEAGLQGKVSIYNGLHEVIPITAKKDLIITHGEAPAPIVATEAPSLNNASQYVVYEGVSFTTDTAFVEGRRHAVLGSWNGQTITFYNQYYIGATLSANKTYNITAVNTIYRTTPQAYPLAVEEVSPAPCIIASGTCGAQGDNLTWTLSCDSVLTISGTGAMADYNNLMDVPWYTYRSSISSVKIAYGVTSIGLNAFELFTSLTSVEISNSVTTIGDNAFGSCSNLTSIEIPNSVTTIIGAAFSHCNGLTSVEIPCSVTRIDPEAFSFCSNLNSIIVDQNSNNYCSKDGVLFNKEVTTIIICPNGKQGAYIIPNSVTSIGKRAFNDCSGLTSIEIPNSVTSIGISAFYDCSGLTSVIIPNSVTSIGNYAFYNCTGLTSVTSKAATPPTCGNNVFFNVNKSIPLFIPTQSITAYQAAKSWKDFTNIQATVDTPEPCVIASGTCGAQGDNLTWTLTCDSILTISGTGAMADYASKRAPWYTSSIITVIIEDGVTSIGDMAFYSCGVEIVEIGDSVTHIGYQAFEDCLLLSSINIPNSITYIGKDVFYNCISLPVINNLRYADSYLVEAVDKTISSIIFKNGTKWIENKAFYNCDNLTSVTIPDGVTSIGEYAFGNCSSLNYIEIPSSVTNIGYKPFTDCPQLTTIYINSDTLVGYYGASSYYDNFGSLFGSQVEHYIIGNNVTRIGEGVFVRCTNMTSVEIPNSVTSIGSRAFEYCTGLTSVTIPNSVTSIGEGAFMGCNGLTYVIWNAKNCNNSGGFGSQVESFVFGKEVETIPSSCCFGMTKLTFVTIPNSVTSIGGSAFERCSGLTSVNIPESVTSIGEWAFSHCNSLTSVTIPNSVTSIGDYAFEYCTGLTSITNQATTPQAINTNVFTNVNKSTCTLYVPAESVEAYKTADVWKEFGNILPIGDDPAPCIIASGTCGAQGDNLTWTLSCDSVLTISGTGAMADYKWNGAPWYSNNEAIRSVIIENSVTSIGDYAFYDCTGLTSIVIPNSVISIGYQTFRNCSSLASLTIPNSVISIGKWAFVDCSGLTSVTIPSSVTSIGYGLFASCSGLTAINVASNNPEYCSIDGILFNKDQTILIQYPGAKQGAYMIPNSVTIIGDGAFSHCSGLTSVTIPNSVTNIGSEAFHTCSSLTAIKIPNSVTRIESATFSNCNVLASVEIPNNITYIGSEAFHSCKGLTSIEIPNGVTTLGATAFGYCSSLTSVAIPSSITLIDWWVFCGCAGLTSITNYATEPQAIDANVFKYIDLSACTLYVPAESVDAYKSADVWKEFGNILPIEGSEEVNYATLADIYNMAADSTFTLGAFDVMYVPDFQSGSNMYIKDSTGSCVIYKVNYGLQAGDHVEAGLQGKVSIYVGLHEIIPITAKEELTITHGEAPAPMVATEAPSLNNASQYVVYEGVSFATDTAFVKGKRHAVPGTWNGQTITFYNQYYIGATLSANKTYNITAVNTIYRTTPQAYPLAVEEVTTDTLEPCLIASGTCGDNLTWELSCDSVLTISGTGEMENSDYSDIPWNSYRNSIKSLIIENGVTSINNYAFQHCESLTYITIPNSVTKGLNYYACNEIISIDVESGNQNYSSIDGVLFNKSQTILMKYPSKNPRTEYSIPSSVTSVRNEAFDQSTNLISITIPNSVRNIGSYYPFSYCTSLISINVATDNPNYSSTDGVLFNKDKTSLIQYPGGKQGEYAIPNSVTSIGEGAFMGCAGLTSIEIPNSITSISSMVFDHCTSLSSVILPDGVTTIEYQAFYSCTNLTSVTIPSSVTSIENHVFSECSNLTLITNYAVEPQAVTQYMFMINWAANHLSNCTLYVPAQSIAAYQTADVWKEFGNILPIEEPIVEPTDSVYDVVYIDQAGLQLDAEPIILHLPVTPVIEGFSFLKWQVVAGDLENGIYIQAVYTANESTNAPEVYTNPANKAQKLIRNGNVYILTGEKVYTVTGQEVR